MRATATLQSSDNALLGDSSVSNNGPAAGHRRLPTTFPIMPQQNNNQENSTSLKGTSRDGSSGSTGANTNTLTNAGPSSDGQFWNSTQRLAKKYRTEVAASASSVLSTMSTFPLDSVKTRMQTYKYAGFVDCVKQTYHTEKLRGFFRGRLLRLSRCLARGYFCRCPDFCHECLRRHGPNAQHNRGTDCVVFHLSAFQIRI